MKANLLTEKEIREAKAFASECHEQTTGMSQKFWEKVVEDCDDELVCMYKDKEKGFSTIAVLWVIVVLFLITVLVGCQTLKGMKADIHWLTADVEHTNTIVKSK